MRAKIGRLDSLDLARGALMVLMALDHASYFVGLQTYTGSEFWSGKFSSFPSFGHFVARFVSHVCAPGFVFFMGLSMALLCGSKSRSDWSRSKFRWYFVKRGLLLVALQFLVENPAWALVDPTYTHYLNVMYLLGGLMAVQSLFLFFSPRALIGIAVGVQGIVLFLLPQAVDAGSNFSLLWYLLLGTGDAFGISSYYPLLPWLGTSLLGLGVGRALLQDRDRTFRWLAVTGWALIAGFFVLRQIPFFNLREFPQAPWALLYATKYPPNLPFLFWNLGWLFVGWTLLDRFGLPARLAAPLRFYGRSTLFFYLVHLYLFAVMGFVVRTTLPGVVLAWMIGLGILIPLCAWYGDFKHRQSSDSLWRLF